MVARTTFLRWVGRRPPSEHAASRCQLADVRAHVAGGNGGLDLSGQHANLSLAEPQEIIFSGQDLL